MYGVLLSNPYNEMIGERVRDAEYMTAPVYTNMAPARLVGGACCRCIGGAEVRADPEANAFRPRGAVYVSSIPTQKYIVPYSIVNYPQYNAVELAEVDMMRSGNHLPDYIDSEMADGMEGGKISKKVRRDFGKIAKALKPIGRALGKAGKKVGTRLGQKALDMAVESALERGEAYLEGALNPSGSLAGDGVNLGKVGRQIGRVGKQVGRRVGKVAKQTDKAMKSAVEEVLPAMALGVSKLTGKGIKQSIRKTNRQMKKVGRKIKKGLAEALDVVRPLVPAVDVIENIVEKAGGAEYRTLPVRPALPTSKPRGRPRKVAGVGVYEGAGAISGAGSGAKSGGATDKRKVRGALISKLMKEKGMTLAQASKHIKEAKLM